MPYTHDQYERLPWWRKFSERWSTALGYILVALATAAGFWGYQRLLDRTDDKVNVVVCGTKFFISDLIEAGSDREAVLERYADRLPTSVDCDEDDRNTP